MKQKEKRYRWATPYEWLIEKIDSGDWDELRLRSELKDLALKLGSDAIQDEYQGEMDEDGYFNEINS